MKQRLKDKIFNVWYRNPTEAYARYGINRVLASFMSFSIAVCPCNGYRYYINKKTGKIIKERIL